MKSTNTCPKCGSHDIIADAKAIDHAHGGSQLDLSVATYVAPDAWIFKGEQKSKLSAWVCCGCGFVEFYADSPESLTIR